MLFKEEKVLEVKKKVSFYYERTRDEEFQLFYSGHLSFAQQQNNSLILKKKILSGGFCDISYRLNTATDKTKSGMMWEQNLKDVKMLCNCQNSRWWSLSS